MKRCDNSRPTIMRISMSSVAPAMGTVPTTLPSRRTVARCAICEHLRQAVGDVDDTNPLIAEDVMIPNRLLRLVIRERLVGSSRISTRTLR